MKQTHGLSRRAVVAGLASAALASACGVAGMASAAAAPRLTIDRFMALSERLAGIDGLDRAFGARLLEALIADPERAERLEALARLRLEGGAGPGAAGEVERLAALAQDIRAAWWSGVFAPPGGRLAYAYEEALHWRALSYTSPAGICEGDFGSWGDPPAR